MIWCDSYDADEFVYSDREVLIARYVMLKRAISAIQECRKSRRCNFIKGWSKKGQPFGSKDHRRRAKKGITMKIAPLFNRLQDNLTDLVIIPKGCKRLYLHQLVVASWSNVLKQRILNERINYSNSSEEINSSGIIELKMDEDEETALELESFFGYMYTETVALSLKTVMVHIGLAIHYEVDSLLVVCMKFIQKKQSTMLIRPFLIEVMDRVSNLEAATPVVEVTVRRIQSELFFEEAEVVSSFDVEFLCDVLRSSDVVANSEYDIFQKLRPKFAELMNAGKRRQVQRLLGLLRLTQMKTSELAELFSGEFMDEMRETFPGFVESVLWPRALLLEGSFDEVPTCSTERPRLYLEVPVPYFNEDTDRTYYHGGHYDCKIDFEFEQRRFEGMDFKIKDGKQILVSGIEKSEMLCIRRVPIYLVTTGERSVKQLSEAGRLEIPSGKFEFVTVRYKLPERRRMTQFKLVMVFCIQTQTETKRKVFTHHADDNTVEDNVQCAIFSLPIGPDCDVSITRAVCYCTTQT